MDCSMPGCSLHGIPYAWHWSGLPFNPSRGDFPNPEIEPHLLHCRQISFLLSQLGSPMLKISHHCMPAKSLQSCPTLCESIDYSPPGSFVHGILQARIMEWVAMSSSMGSSKQRDLTRISYVSCIGRWVFFFFTTCTSWKAPPKLLDGVH